MEIRTRLFDLLDRYHGRIMCVLFVAEILGLFILKVSEPYTLLSIVGFGLCISGVPILLYALHDIVLHVIARWRAKRLKKRIWW